MINGIYEKPTVNIIFNGKRLKAFHTRLGMRQGCLLLSLLFNTVQTTKTMSARQKYNKLQRKK